MAKSDSNQEPSWSRLPGSTPVSEPVVLTAPQRGSGVAAPPSQGINYGQIAWSHKFLLLGCLLLGLAGGCAYDVLKKPLYAASTTVELVGFNQSFMGMSSVDPQAGTDALRESTSNVQTQIRILTSRSLLRRVTDRMNLELTPVSSVPTTFFTRLRNRIPYLRKDPFVQSREALGMAASTVSARVVPPTRLVEISCTSTSPEVAATLVNLVASEHMAQAVASRANVTQRSSQFVESQLEEARSRLQQASEKLREFVMKSGVDFFPEQATLADTQMRQLQQEVGSATADRIAKQSRWEMVKSTSLESLPDVVSDQNLQGLKSQLIGLRTEMAQLTSTLTPEHYRVKRLQARVDEILQTLEKEKASLVVKTQSDYQEALRKERLENGAYRAQTHTVAGQSDKAAQYALLKRDVDAEQTQYNDLMKQANQAALIALAPTSGIRVVDAAGVNRNPISPKPTSDIPTWGLGGLGIGFGLLLLREFTRRKKLTKLFDAPGHTQTVLGVPELGVIPSTQLPGARGKLLFGAPNGSGLSIANGNGHANGNGLSAGNWESDRSSLLSESFRQTLVSLLRTKPDDHSPVYVITSAGPGEGKTTLSANLARAMAEIGQRVLLVDADLRRPNLHTLFGSHEHDGLSDILAGSANIEKLDLARYIQPTQVENLSVMTHGLTQVETPALLFFSPRVGELVELLQTRFDCILFDTAPALPFPDARLWGKHADGVVMVVRSGVTTRSGASAACERFLNDGISVLGTILNDWTPSDSSSQGYQYGGAYHSVGPKR